MARARRARNPARNSVPQVNEYTKPRPTKIMTSTIPSLREIAGRISPVSTTFTASLLLSFIAWLGSSVNRDGMLYVKAAQAFIDGGLSAAHELFNWPFLPVTMGMISTISGLSPEAAGFSLNAFFMAGTCALMVASIERKQRELAWVACLTVLALPGFNEYRNELLREYGCWFFLMLSFWSAQRWTERPRWANALAVQAALGTAALFRPESLAFFPALIAWQCFEAPRHERMRRLLMLGALPLLGAASLGVLYAGGHLDQGGRLAGEFNRIDTLRFDTKAQALAGALIEYAKGQARTILFFGSLALVPIKLVQKLGFFLLPLAVFTIDPERFQVVRRHALLAWASVTHLLVLSIFVIDLQFLAGRYVGLTLLFSVPFAATGLLAIIRHFPRWRFLVIAALIVTMISNVVSSGLGKTHLVAAGHWLSANVTDVSRVYIDSGRTAYHAGWLKVVPATRNDRQKIEQAIASRHYDIFVLEVSRKDPPIEPWLQMSGLQVIRRFDHPNHDALLVAKPDIKP